MNEQGISNKDYMSVKDYVRVLREKLPKDIYKPNRMRLFVLAVHILLISLYVYLILLIDNIWIELVFSVLAGYSLGLVGFLGHEILHGTVVRNRMMQNLLGGFCMFQFGLHPRVWKCWHNRQHHGNTQDPIYDPDCFGHVMLYRYSPLLRKIEKLLPGSKYIRSYFFLLYWFFLHNIIVIFYYSNNFMSKADRIKGRIYFIVVISVWLLAAVTADTYGVLTLMIVPLMISNVLMMSHIATNHFLCPLTQEINDPLVNSLTIRAPALIERLHLNFGYHVEHHVMPGVNPVHARKIHKLLKELWPDKYKEMNHIKALRLLYKTPRFYLNENTLSNPRTGEVFHTL